MRASIIVPTSGRPGYLEVALWSIAAQAAQRDSELIVVDDGEPGRAPETRAAAERFGARYVRNRGERGLNRARNLGIEAATGELLVFVDDDIAARPGWLAALLAGPADHGVLTGPIRARFEDHRLRMCGREGPPITFLDLGPADTESDRAWGANLAIRRGEIERLGGFDEAWATGAGDEEAWVRRYRAAGGRIRYLAGAAVDHRRAGDDARLRSLARAAHARGRSARRFDAARGEAPSAVAEARVLAGCLVHAARFACANGLVLGAHAGGRLREAIDPAPPAPAEDFLAGTSGTVAGRRAVLRRLADRALDALAAPQRLRLRRAAGRAGRERRVLVVGAHRTPRRLELPGADVDLRAPQGGKFDTLNAILADHDLDAYDWLLVIDDDVELPRSFLDGFLHVAERLGLRLAQPAQTLASHAAWPVVRRRARSVARETTFVEIGPVTAFHRDTFATLLPFPDLRMAWGLDLHWAALARERGWRLGIVDLLPVRHELAPVASDYPRDEAIGEARAFLADRPYLRRDEINTLAVHRRLPAG